MWKIKHFEFWAISERELIQGCKLYEIKWLINFRCGEVLIESEIRAIFFSIINQANIYDRLWDTSSSESSYFLILLIKKFNNHAELVKCFFFL